MNKTFREIYQEQRQLSSAIAKHWGYNVKNISLDNRFKKEFQGKIPIVANINSLKLTKDIPKTQRILQVQQQLRAIQNGRLLAKFTEEAARKSHFDNAQQDRSLVIVLMEQKVKQYNHIITHKHLNKDYNEETRRILKIDKDQAEQLIQKIQKSEMQLKEGNLSTQIKLNKYLAQLYKSYRAKIEISRNNSSKHHSKTKTMISEPAKSGHNITKHEQIPKIQLKRRFSKQHSEKKAVNSKSDRALLINIQNVQNSLRFTQGRVNSHHGNSHYPRFYHDQMNYGNITDRTSNRKVGSRQQQERIIKTINSPFLQKQRLDQYRNIEKSNNSNYATLDMFKTKISDYKITNISQRHVKTKKATTTHQYSIQDKSSISKIKIDTNRTNNSITMNQQQKTIYNSIIAQNKEKYYQQKTIFAQLLKKRHNKFNRIGLSRVLVKYDQQKEAKSLLKGNRPKQDSHSPDEIHALYGGSRTSRNHNKVRQNISEGIEAVYDDSQEDQHYERMCKNEKINLLLKHR